MQITESNKQEAEKVVFNIIRFEKYMFSYTDIERGKIRARGKLEEKSAIILAIQDRQSVLELAKKVYKIAKENATESTYLPIKTEITNLTEQIEYLKSKL